LESLSLVSTLMEDSNSTYLLIAAESDLEDTLADLQNNENEKVVQQAEILLRNDFPPLSCREVVRLKPQLRRWLSLLVRIVHSKTASCRNWVSDQMLDSRSRLSARSANGDAESRDLVLLQTFSRIRFVVIVR
jgi:hypothetical protein